ncbi:hypothetical protein J6590_063886, partial [Homalodisca vitripennis]
MEGRGGGDYQFLQGFQSCKWERVGVGISLERRHHENRERGERKIRRHYSVHERQTRRAPIRDNNKNKMREFVWSRSPST